MGSSLICPQLLLPLHPLLNALLQTLLTGLPKDIRAPPSWKVVSVVSIHRVDFVKYLFREFEIFIYRSV